MNNNNDGFNIDDVVLTKKQVTSIITKRAKSLFKEDVIKISGFYNQDSLLSNIEQIRDKAIDYVNENLPDKLTLDQLNEYDLANRVFNEDYFIIGYGKATEFIGLNFFGWAEWLKDDMDLELNDINIENSEQFVNYLAYWVGTFICSAPYDVLVEIYLEQIREDKQNEKK
tara:strand:+ start:1948 stop:2457 length:510 start_codon:yes stop_codon:yes gene_type:complete